MYQNGTRTTPGSNYPTLALRTLKGWSSRHNWQARVDAWELLQRAAEAEEWKERRERWREEAYRLNEAAIDRVHRMLSFPLSQKVVLERYEDGREKVVRIEPVRWNMGHVAQLMNAIMKINQLLFGDISVRIDHHHSGTVGLTGDYSHLSEEELNAEIDKLLSRLGSPGPLDIRVPSFTAISSSTALNEPE
jgi:hypothetical protein